MIGNWKRSAQISDLLVQDATDADVNRLARLIVERLNQVIPENDPIRDQEYNEIIAELASADSCDEANGLLVRLYNWGDDARRLWLDL